MGGDRAEAVVDVILRESGVIFLFAFRFRELFEIGEPRKVGDDLGISEIAESLMKTGKFPSG